jgi:hypothetical protein
MIRPRQRGDNGLFHRIKDKLNAEQNKAVLVYFERPEAILNKFFMLIALNLHSLSFKDLKAMKLTSGLILLIVLSLPSFAQKGKKEIVMPAMPKNETTGLISYSGREEAATTAKSVLYERALAWANAFYKNPAEVIREKDPEKGKILIKGRYRIANEPDKKGVVTQAGNVMYTLTVEFKDNAWRYEITNMNWQQTSAFPIERWMDTASQSFTPNYPYYLTQTDEELRKVESSLKKAMTAGSKAKGDDW